TSIGEMIVAHDIRHGHKANHQIRADGLRRRHTVEHPFGTIKQWMYQGAFLMRRLEKVRGEFSLTALAYNIRRAITLVGVPGLLAAVRT
ncbi:DDE family transposase, partial [Rhizobium sp. PP-F2F-G48]|uniref:transposase n=1 Tax=Rhizobium sp. PP-F2F-G48 TaxID=2135651 RepID=UPI0010E7217B